MGLRFRAAIFLLFFSLSGNAFICKKALTEGGNLFSDVIEEVWSAERISENGDLSPFTRLVRKYSRTKSPWDFLKLIEAVVFYSRTSGPYYRWERGQRNGWETADLNTSLYEVIRQTCQRRRTWAYDIEIIQNKMIETLGKDLQWDKPVIVALSRPWDRDPIWRRYRKSWRQSPIDPHLFEVRKRLLTQISQYADRADQFHGMKIVWDGTPYSPTQMRELMQHALNLVAQWNNPDLAAQALVYLFASEFHALISRYDLGEVQLHEFSLRFEALLRKMGATKDFIAATLSRLQGELKAEQKGEIKNVVKSSSIDALKQHLLFDEEVDLYGR